MYMGMRRPPILYSRSDFEKINKTTFDIKNIFKSFELSIKEPIGMPEDYSYVKDENICFMDYLYLIDEPDPSSSDGTFFRATEKITIKIEIKRSKGGGHTLKECFYKRAFATKRGK